MLDTKEESSLGPDGLPYSVYRCAGGLGSQMLFATCRPLFGGSGIPPQQNSIIKTALLSGDVGVRNIFISPPDDVRQLLNLDHATVLRLREAVYGLVNAPKKWWDRLKTSLIEHGFTSCALDPCALVLPMSGKIHGVLGVCMSIM